MALWLSGEGNTNLIKDQILFFLRIVGAGQEKDCGKETGRVWLIRRVTVETSWY